MQMNHSHPRRESAASRASGPAFEKKEKEKGRRTAAHIERIDGSEAGKRHFSSFGAGATGGIPACATAWLNAFTSVSRIFRYSARDASRRPVRSL